jgi:dodecin
LNGSAVGSCAGHLRKTSDFSRFQASFSRWHRICARQPCKRPALPCLARNRFVGYGSIPLTFYSPLGVTMTVAKILEITSSSKKSFEDAISQGIARAAETISDIQGAWVQDQKVVVSKGKVTEYRVSLKITFVLAGKKK